jgi:hypothetical protein
MEEGETMKMVFVAYNQAIDSEVMEVLDALGVEGYTKWTEVLGSGRAGGPHLLSHIWPKGNNAMSVVTDDETGAKLMEGLRELKANVGSEGLKAFLLPVEDAT